MITDINNMPFVGNLRLGRNLYYIEVLTYLNVTKLFFSAAHDTCICLV